MHHHEQNLAPAFVRFGAVPLGEMRAYLELHHTALDWNRDPRAYLTVEISASVVVIAVSDTLAVPGVETLLSESSFSGTPVVNRRP